KTPVRKATVRTRLMYSGLPGDASGLKLANIRIATAFVGPAIMCKLDPNSADSAGGTIAAYRPYCGGRPARMAKATPCGNRSTAPVRPATRSARVVCRLTSGHQRRKGKTLASRGGDR